ncbi:hypothetical protein L1987_39027 [Smallanthus sonchifolius]|uniref:Uncharacterized protein n=1 Tax=Smallanthus sonchifolius TaxID=185202 RepID=A0ACB9HKP6_9ASTR|nr:hypothetical protein L1987_39027 [Smallanthus sonchifolius]
MESISMGVPMHSDQPRNAFFVTDVLKIGIVVKNWERRNELVTAEVVAEVVKRLMGSEEGAESGGVGRRSEGVGGGRWDGNGLFISYVLRLKGINKKGRMKMVGISMAMDGAMVATSTPVATGDDVATTNSDELSDKKENETAVVIENNVKILSVQKVDYIDVNKELDARGQNIRRVKNNQADNLFHDKPRDMPNEAGGNEKIRDSGLGVHVKYMKWKDKSKEGSPKIKIKEMRILLRIEDLGGTNSRLWGRMMV